jgi:hypothetical protein
MDLKITLLCFVMLAGTIVRADDVHDGLVFRALVQEQIDQLTPDLFDKDDPYLFVYCPELQTYLEYYPELSWRISRSNPISMHLRQEDKRLIDSCRAQVSRKSSSRGDIDKLAREYLRTAAKAHIARTIQLIEANLSANTPLCVGYKRKAKEVVTGNICVTTAKGIAVESLSHWFASNPDPNARMSQLVQLVALLALNTADNDFVVVPRLHQLALVLDDPRARMAKRDAEMFRGLTLKLSFIEEVRRWEAGRAQREADIAKELADRPRRLRDEAARDRRRELGPPEID